MTRRALACAIAVSALAPVAAQAGPPGTWTKVTGSEENGHATGELGLYRTPDGVLHVAYVVQPSGGAPDRVVHRAIASDARSVAGPDTVATLKTLNPSLALVAGPAGGLRVFFAGRTDEAGSDFLRTSTSDAAGRAWTVGVAASNPGGLRPGPEARGIFASVGFDGKPVSIWGDSSSPGTGGYHLGLDAGQTDYTIGQPCCAVDPALAVDGATGRLFAAWNASADETAVAAPFDGPPVRVPGSGVQRLGERVAITGRGAGKAGIYVAFTAGEAPYSGRPVLWKFGGGVVKVIHSRLRGRHVGIAPAGDGRLWIFWTDNGRVVATRTNRAATRFGAPVTISQPSGTVDRLAGEGSLGFLDVLGLFEKGASDVGYWHQRILPGLAIRGPKEIRPGRRYTFTVVDAGEAVPGARVKWRFGSRTVSGTTNARGKVRLRVPATIRPGRSFATASKAGYARMAARVKP